MKNITAIVKFYNLTGQYSRLGEMLAAGVTMYCRLCSVFVFLQRDHRRL